MCGNLFSCFNTSQLNKTFTSLRQGLGQKLSGLSVSLSCNDGRLLGLFRFFNEESGLLGFLLGNLLLFDGHGELAAKGQVCDGDVVED
jgi:hypothetical protein